MASFDRSTTYAKVVDIIAKKLGVDESGISEKTTFQDLGADSIDMVEIIMRLEDTFGLEISDEAAETLENLGQVVDLIHQGRTK